MAITLPWLKGFIPGRGSIPALLCRLAGTLVPWWVGVSMVQGGIHDDGGALPFFTDFSGPMDAARLRFLLADVGPSLWGALMTVVVIGGILKLFTTGAALGFLKGQGPRRALRLGGRLFFPYLRVALLGAVAFAILGGVTGLIGSRILEYGALEGWTTVERYIHGGGTIAALMWFWGTLVAWGVLHCRVRMALGESGRVRRYLRGTFRSMGRHRLGAFLVIVVVGLLTQGVSGWIIFPHLSDETQWGALKMAMLAFFVGEAFLWHGLHRGAVLIQGWGYSK